MIIYDIIFILFSLFYIPFSIFKNGRRSFNLRQRCGIGLNVGARHAWHLQNTIWLHAVSVGEVMTLATLVDKLRAKMAGWFIVVSVTTKTGYDAARKNLGQIATVIYSPLDLSFIVNRFFKLIRPKILVIIETEIWPNMLHIAKKNNVPVIIINGRISIRSFGRYKIAEPFLRPTLEKIDLFCIQSEADASRIISIGAPAERVKVTGNMKFDVCPIGTGCQIPDTRKKLGLDGKDILIVAGSTHKGEEEILLGAYKELSKDFDNLKLLIAPRHIDRVPRIEALVKKAGFISVRVGAGLPRPYNLGWDSSHFWTFPIFLLDAIGRLKDFYFIADIVFIGGSMVPHGGQNPIEPAYFSKPIIFGPFMFNFREISHTLLNAKAAIEVKNIVELKKSIAFLIAEPRKAVQMGNFAKDAIEQNKGASEKNIEMIRRFLS